MWTGFHWQALATWEVWARGEARPCEPVSPMSDRGRGMHIL